MGLGVGVVGQVPCWGLGPLRRPTNTLGTRGQDVPSQGSASCAGRWQGRGMASSILALPAFLAFPQAGSSGARRAGGTAPTASSPGSAWL